MTKRIRSRAWKFTVNNVDICDRAQLQLDLESKGLEYVFQMEKGENTGMIHFQGVCRYENPRDNWPNIKGCHWGRCRNWKFQKGYCSKRNTRISGPWTNIKNLIVRKSLIDPMEGLELRKFQLEIMEILECGKNPDNRKIHWFWELEGNSGKSSLAKHIIMTRNAVLLGGSSKDAFCCLSKYNETKDIDIVIFDIPRCSFNRISYKTIESVKNGMVFSPKYESNFIVFNPPHVVVLCNFPPDRTMLSADRWDVRNIV